MASPTDYLANERTFLAWVRTALSLMGFGFVVARFGLFLQEMHVADPRLPVRSPGLSLWFGTALIGLGIVISIAAIGRHLHMVDTLNKGGEDFKHPSCLAISISVLLAIIGTAMALYLVFVHR